MESEHKDDMQKSQIKEIKKDNRKKGILFILYICGGGVLGAMVSTFTKEEDILSLYGSLYEFTVTQANVLIFLLIIVLVTISIVTFVWVFTTVSWSLNLMKKEDMEDEEYEEVEKIEKKLSKVLGSTNFFMILQYFLFSFGTYLFANKSSKVSVNLFLSFTVIFLVGVVIIPYLQQKLLTVERLLNPEKKGSVYDIKFAKKWEECCDEREKYNIYKSAYKAYLAVINTCLLLWVVCIISGILTGSGFAPALTILIIWGVSVCVYNYHCNKNE